MTKMCIRCLSVVIFLSFALSGYPGSKVKSSRSSAEVVSTLIRYRLYDKKRSRFSDLKKDDFVSEVSNFMITIKNSKKCYVYILNIDSTNKLTVLFPNDNITYKNPLKGDKGYMFPPDTKKEKLMFGFDNTKGIETFYTFISVEPHSEIEELIEEIPEEGLKLKKGGSYITELEEAYKSSAVKNDSGFDSEESDNRIMFKDIYASKLTLHHGSQKENASYYKNKKKISKGRLMTQGGAYLNEQEVLILVSKRYYKEVHSRRTKADGTFYFYPPDVGRGIILTNYKGELLSNYIDFIGTPTVYRLTVVDMVSKVKKGDKYNTYKLIIEAKRGDKWAK